MTKPLASLCCRSLRARRTGAAVLFALLLALPPCRAADEALGLVVRAMRAKCSQTYEARQVILWVLPAEQGGGAIQIVTQTTRAGMRSRTAYLFPPDAAGRVMADDGLQTLLYEPQKHLLLASPSVAREMAADSRAMSTLLRRNYQAQIARHERINGCLCAVVLLRRRGQDGPYKVLWIDQAHPFVLRQEEHDADGACRYVSSYDSITFCKHLPDEALRLPPDAAFAARRALQEAPLDPAPSHVIQALTAAGVPGARLPAWTPSGYALLRVARVTLPGGGLPMAQLRYSDGLRTLTVLEGAANTPLPPPVLLSRALARYGQQAWVQDAGGQRTLVRSELSGPPEAGQEMLAALLPQTEARLLRGLAQDFGAAAPKQAAALRRDGWDWAQVTALAIYGQAHPQSHASVRAMLGRRQGWPAIARRLRADMGTLDAQARAWIGAACKR